MTDEMEILLEKARNHKMTEEERTDQRVSYAYGNSPATDHSTKEDVRKAVTTSEAPEE